VDEVTSRALEQLVAGARLGPLAGPHHLFQEVAAGDRPQRGLHVLRVDLLGKVAVLDVGYNDAPGGFGAGVDRVMRALLDAGVDQVVWITLRERRPSWAEINDQIREARKRWPQLTVGEWELESRAHDAATVGVVIGTRGTSARNLAAGRPATLSIIEPEAVVYAKLRPVDGPLPVSGGETWGLGYFLLEVTDVLEDAAADWESGMAITSAIAYRPVPSLDAPWARATLAGLAAPRARA